MPPDEKAMEIRKPDFQMMLQDQASNLRMLTDSLRQAEKRIQQERELARWEQEKQRQTLTAQIVELEKQIEALVGVLGRLQTENEQLRRDLAVAKVSVKPPSSEEPQAAPIRTVPMRSPLQPMALVNDPEALSRPSIKLPPPMESSGPKI